MPVSFRNSGRLAQTKPCNERMSSSAAQIHRAAGPHGRGISDPLNSQGTLFQLIQMLQSRQNDLFARLFNLARKKHLVEDSVYLVKVEDQVQFADVAEESVEDLDEEVDSLEVGQLIVIGVDTRAEEEACVATVDDLVVAKLDEVGLVFLVTRCYKPMDLMITVRSESANQPSSGKWFRRKQTGVARTSPLSLIFSSSLYGTYHLASRVLPLFSRTSESLVVVFFALG